MCTRRYVGRAFVRTNFFLYLVWTLNKYYRSTRPTGDLVPSIQHVHLTRTFICAVYMQLTAASIAPPKKNLKNNPGYVHEAKTYLLLIIQNTSLHWNTWGQEYCTVNGGNL